MQNGKVFCHEIYNFDRLEKAAKSLHLEETEEVEIGLLNLHNHLVWHSYRPGIDQSADAILSSVISELMEEYNLDASDFPAEFQEIASSVVERRQETV